MAWTGTVAQLPREFAYNPRSPIISQNIQKLMNILILYLLIITSTEAFSFGLASIAKKVAKQGTQTARKAGSELGELVASTNGGQRLAESATESSTKRIAKTTKNRAIIGDDLPAASVKSKSVCLLKRDGVLYRRGKNPCNTPKRSMKIQKNNPKTPETPRASQENLPPPQAFKTPPARPQTPPTQAYNTPQAQRTPLNDFSTPQTPQVAAVPMPAKLPSFSTPPAQGAVPMRPMSGNKPTFAMPSFNTPPVRGSATPNAGLPFFTTPPTRGSAPPNAGLTHLRPRPDPKMPSKFPQPLSKLQRKQQAPTGPYFSMDPASPPSMGGLRPRPQSSSEMPAFPDAFPDAFRPISPAHPSRPVPQPSTVMKPIPVKSYGMPGMPSSEPSLSSFQATSNQFKPFEPISSPGSPTSNQFKPFEPISSPGSPFDDEMVAIYNGSNKS